MDAPAATPEQIQHIRQTAELYVSQTIQHPSNGKIVATASPIDNRIYASDCPSGLSVSLPSPTTTSSRVTTLVSCPSENWKVYVSVHISIRVPAVTSLRPLSRGQVIGQDDVRLGMVDILQFKQQGFSSINQVIGAKLKKNITPNQLIRQHDVCIICRYDAVRIEAIHNGLRISTQGVALSDGAYGESIRVKNKQSNRIIDATVTAIGVVSVHF